MSGCMAAGCEASNSPNGQVAVCNKDGSFSYSTNAGMTTKTDTYTWTNGEATADVHWALNLGMGSASITVKDAAGKTVFTKSISKVGQESGTKTTQAGQAGEWTVDVKLNNASGQVAFEVNSS